MPMNDISTLIYLVNNFQADLNETSEIGSEQLVTGGENTLYSPKKQTINTILNFARSYEVLESKSTGCVEMILN